MNAKKHGKDRMIEHPFHRRDRFFWKLEGAMSNVAKEVVNELLNMGAIF